MQTNTCIASLPHHSYGFSLIEVLVATLIFSIGLLGSARLMMLAMRSTHGAYVRTQVIFLAGNLADRMQANPVAAASGAYNGAYPVAGGPACAWAAPCTPAQLAARDRYAWSHLLMALLPQAFAEVTCTAAQTAGQGIAAPYNGHCTLIIHWMERHLDVHSEASIQSFTWQFQP